MSDLAQRIMNAWLLTNPKPSENPERAEWWSNYHRLQAMVKLSAYESAVIQFLVPEGWSYETLVCGEKYGSSGVDASLSEYDPGDGEYEGSGKNIAEALLNAIESANQ